MVASPGADQSVLCTAFNGSQGLWCWRGDVRPKDLSEMKPSQHPLRGGLPWDVLLHPICLFKIVYLLLFLAAIGLCCFLAACGLSLVADSGGYSSWGAQASHCGGFSCCRAQV